MGKIERIEVPAADRERLERLVRHRNTPQKIVWRARIVLLTGEGLRATEVAARVGTSTLTVRRWRRRWLTRPHGAVLERLHDAPRPVTHAPCSVEQWCQIMALACEPPANSGRPISHCTPRELADEAIKRGIVTTISERHGGRFLKAGRSQTAPESLLAQSCA